MHSLCQEGTRHVRGIGRCQHCCATKLLRLWVSQALWGLVCGGDVGLRADDVGRPWEVFGMEGQDPICTLKRLLWMLLGKRQVMVEGMGGD